MWHANAHADGLKGYRPGACLVPKNRELATARYAPLAGRRSAFSTAVETLRNGNATCWPPPSLSRAESCEDR